MHLTLVIPELIWHEPSELDPATHRTPALDRLLHWGHGQRASRRPVETVLADVLGDARPHTQRPLSLSEARAQGEAPPLDCPPGTRIVCADPIHLHFHQDRMLVADANLDPLLDAEAESLIQAINAQFSDTLRLIPASPARWYAWLDADFAEHLGPLPDPLSSVAGTQLPPDGFGQSPTLRRLANELQMSLHAHPITQARIDAGRRAMNALWIWGDSLALSASSPTTLATPASEPLPQGLAKGLGHRTRALPTEANTLLATMAAGTVAFLDALAPPSRYQDMDAYTVALQQLEHDWFAPLSAAIVRGRLTALRLVATGAYGVLDWNITPPTRWARRPWAAAPPTLANRARDLARIRPT